MTAELLANSTRESSIIDQVCTESNALLETATDTIRSVAETTGLDMTTILILSIAIPIVVLIPIAFMCLSGVVLLMLIPVIYLIMRCRKGGKKARKPTKVKSIE